MTDKVLNSRWRFFDLSYQIPKMSSAVWEKLLKAEDEGEEKISKATQEGAELIEKKRHEANDKVNEMKKEYKKKLDKTKKESDRNVKKLQEQLKTGQQKGKENSSKQVLLHKDEIVKILLDAVLKVDIAKK